MREADTLQNDRQKAIQLANETMKLARNTLVIHLRFMDTAISRLQWYVVDDATFAVDGERIYYDPIHVLRLYLGEKEQVSRAYLHMIFHCVFRHFFISSLIDQPLWDLACDIAVENMIAELQIPEICTSRDRGQAAEMNRLKKSIGKLTAEKIYHYLRENPSIDSDRLAALFTVDDHRIWYSRNEESDDTGDGEGSDDDGEGNNGSAGNSANGDQDSDTGDDTDNAGSAGLDGLAGDDSEQRSNTVNHAGKKQLEQMWKDVSERMQTDLETFSKQHGDTAGSLMQNLQAVNREKYDYADFLKRFAVMNEAMRINDDEFDYVFYSYGMNLFAPRRMPLIEPLEYKEVKQIREFVIAIDTSGSVSGTLVQRFVQKTYNILKTTESFASRINLHIIQCDTDIQEHVKVTSQEEFDMYLNNMKLKGFGGTDFRPVFETVNRMVERREFENLKGLIYFTDGYGVFPERKPAYKAAFVFVEDDLEAIPRTPPWAIRLMLPKEDIEEAI